MKNQHTVWRWVALAAVLVNIFFNYYLNANPIGGQTMGDISDKHPTLITPAGYAFSIWGVIYLLFIIYSIYQVLPNQRKNQAYNQLTLPLIATSMLSIAWLIIFSLEYMGLSVLIISSMLITAILLFGKAKTAVSRGEARSWITIPFALYMAWLSVATVVNIAVWLKDMGWQGGTPGETPWTILMIVVVLALGILISYKFRDIPYPLVIAWATFAIYAARQKDNTPVATAALISGILLVIWSVGYAIWQVKKRQPENAWQA
jgi:tryptophan-rich sensory protein